MPATDATSRTPVRRKERISYENVFSINGKTPPQAVEIEQAVLGALMLDQFALSSSIENLRTEYFYKPEHQAIFSAIRELFEKSQQVDILTVTHQLQLDGRLEEAGGAYYVAQLTNHVVSAAHIEYHARILGEKFIQRELIRISTETITSAYDESTDVITLLDSTEQRLLDINDKNFRSDYRMMDDVVRQAFEQIEAAQDSDGNPLGTLTGFTDLDRLTAGFQPGTLLILAARPAMGKTAFALTMARNMAVDLKKHVAVFSLEMTAVELVMRLISAEAGINGEKLKKGEKLGDAEKEQLYRATQTLSGANLYIDDTPQLTIFELRAKCRRLKQSKGLDMVYIDYLQLMQGNTDQNRNGNREQEISYISRQLKALAKELEIPVMALSQLSRAVETRGGSKEPMLSDLRESGAIEQDADIVMFIYRPEYYGIDEDDKGSTRGKAYINVAKHRSGATDKIRLNFVREFAKFSNDDNITFGDTPYTLPVNTGFDANGPMNTIIRDSSINWDEGLSSGGNGDNTFPPAIDDNNPDTPF